jgi:hypothetical protein
MRFRIPEPAMADVSRLRTAGDHLRDGRQPSADFAPRIALGELLGRHAIDRQRIEPTLGRSAPAAPTAQLFHASAREDACPDISDAPYSGLALAAVARGCGDGFTRS